MNLYEFKDEIIECNSLSNTCFEIDNFDIFEGDDYSCNDILKKKEKIKNISNKLNNLKEKVCKSTEYLKCVEILFNYAGNNCILEKKKESLKNDNLDDDFCNSEKDIFFDGYINYFDFFHVENFNLFFDKYFYISAVKKKRNISYNDVLKKNQQYFENFSNSKIQLSQLLDSNEDYINLKNIKNKDNGYSSYEKIGIQEIVKSDDVFDDFFKDYKNLGDQDITYNTKKKSIQKSSYDLFNKRRKLNEYTNSFNTIIESENYKSDFTNLSLENKLREEERNYKDFFEKAVENSNKCNIQRKVIIFKISNILFENNNKEKDQMVYDVNKLNDFNFHNKKNNKKKFNYDNYNLNMKMYFPEYNKFILNKSSFEENKEDKKLSDINFEKKIFFFYNSLLKLFMHINTLFRTCIELLKYNFSDLSYESKVLSNDSKKLIKLIYLFQKQEKYVISFSKYILHMAKKYFLNSKLILTNEISIIKKLIKILLKWKKIDFNILIKFTELKIKDENVYKAEIVNNNLVKYNFELRKIYFCKYNNDIVISLKKIFPLFFHSDYFDICKNQKLISINEKIKNNENLKKHCNIKIEQENDKNTFISFKSNFDFYLNNLIEECEEFKNVEEEYCFLTKVQDTNYLNYEMELNINQMKIISYLNSILINEINNSEDLKIRISSKEEEINNIFSDIKDIYNFLLKKNKNVQNISIKECSKIDDNFKNNLTKSDLENNDEIYLNNELTYGKDIITENSKRNPKNFNFNYLSSINVKEGSTENNKELEKENFIKNYYLACNNPKKRMRQNENDEININFNKKSYNNINKIYILKKMIKNIMIFLEENNFSSYETSELKNSIINDDSEKYLKEEKKINVECTQYLVKEDKLNIYLNTELEKEKKKNLEFRENSDAYRKLENQLRMELDNEKKINIELNIKLEKEKEANDEFNKYLEREKKINSELNSELEKEKKMIGELNVELEKEKNVSIELNTELEKEKKKLEKEKKMNDELNLKLEKEKKCISELNSELEKEKKVNNELNIELEKEKKTNIEFNEHLEREKKVNAYLDIELKKKEDTNNELNIALEKEKKENSKLNYELEKEKKINSELNTELEQEKKMNDELTLKLEKKNKFDSELNLELGKEKKVNSELNIELEKEKKVNSELNIELEKEKNVNSELNLELGKEKKVNSELNIELEKEKKVNSELNIELEKGKNVNSELNLELEKEKKVNSELNIELEKEKNVNSELNLELEKEKNVNSELNAELEKEKNVNSELNLELEKEKKKIKEQTDKLIEQDKLIEEMKKKLELDDKKNRDTELFNDEANFISLSKEKDEFNIIKEEEEFKKKQDEVFVEIEEVNKFEKLYEKKSNSALKSIEEYNKLYDSYIEIVLKKENLEKDFEEKMNYFNKKMSHFDKKVKYFDEKILHYKKMCNIYEKNSVKVNKFIKTLEGFIKSVEKSGDKINLNLHRKLDKIKISLKEINENSKSKIIETDNLLFDEIINEKNILLEKIADSEKEKPIYDNEMSDDLKKYMIELNFKSINELYIFHSNMLEELSLVKKNCNLLVEENIMKNKEYENHILKLSKCLSEKEKEINVINENCKSLLLELDNLKYILNDLLSFGEKKISKHNNIQIDNILRKYENIEKAKVLEKYNIMEKDLDENILKLKDGLLAKDGSMSEDDNISKDKNNSLVKSRRSSKNKNKDLIKDNNLSLHEKKKVEVIRQYDLRSSSKKK
ncbi:conserved Plasmodium protein, unknown function [Plasmodium relictum]|uniref:Uncharacterized protein n=1 Tax=Plasmodium relictum TaxID=85471 RepID=A0A1J1H0J4_PLARL|nr:conserved Plasmodium protein, unknown function [Plasmodium relictum]CRG98433.1 conserved Plasmodium protein, unknown function [Plasmodium relictum]